MASKKKGRKKKRREESKDKSMKIHYREKRSSMRPDEDRDEEVDVGEDEDVGIKGEEERDRGAKSAEVVVDQLMRLQAEFENYRKRVQKERLESWDMAKRDLVLALLPFVDDMRRMAEWDDESVEVKSLQEGMKLTADKLMSILKEEGFEKIDAIGKPFDPNFHEALLSQDVADAEKDNLVAEVLVEGYLFKGVLLRPARVKVFKYKDGEETADGKVGDDAGGT